MAVAARKSEVEYAYLPATLVYSKAAAQRAREEEQAELARREQRSQRVSSVRVAGREAMRKLSMMLCVAVAMGAILLVLMRYSGIAEAYGAVNELRDNIEQTRRTITALNVELNSAVSLQEARDAAEEAGLGYPRSDQIITVRGRLPAEEARALGQIEVVD